MRSARASSVEIMAPPFGWAAAEGASMPRVAAGPHRCARQLGWMPPGPLYLLRSTLATASLRRQRRTAGDTTV
ncbi:hypothetical protein GCM10011512_21180 [Tersicoccus solisilvae]|uniref:Uncharacterized protein n=1 Tax=Tersicoccus solisilvae TaxID=1882339 RepID=A0ABQ1PA93_9MICC|nr:hypothetical protein GCM10011512_21180 [Tersicoccus solisilvae]